MTFANNGSLRVTNSLTGSPVNTTDQVQAALYWAPLGSATFVQIGAAIPVGVPLPGLFAGGSRTTGTDTPGGAFAQFQVKAWGGGYATFEQAQQNTGALLGQSAVVEVLTGNPSGAAPTPPGSLVGGGLQGFGLTPNSAQPPTMTCSTNKTVGCADTWIFDPPTALDGCTGANLPVWLLTTQTNYLGCSNLITASWTATNSCNSLSSTCDQMVTVLFNQPPMFDCPAAKTVSGTNEWTFETPTAYDPCSGSNFLVTPLGAVTNCFASSNIVVQTWTATNTCNGFGSTCSQSVTVLLGPSFTVQPLSQVVSPGQSVTFTAQAAGFPPLTYQWQFNGVDIAGATDTSYTLSSTTITNIGSYDVVIANSVNTNTSGVATLSFVNLSMLAAVCVTGPNGANYQVQATPALGPTNWTTLTNVTITSQPYIYVDYSTPTNSKQFYRAVPQ